MVHVDRVCFEINLERTILWRIRDYYIRTSVKEKVEVWMNPLSQTLGKLGANLAELVLEMGLAELNCDVADS